MRKFLDGQNMSHEIWVINQADTHRYIHVGVGSFLCVNIFIVFVSLTRQKLHSDCGLCLGMAKFEAFDKHNLMYQAVRVCHTDHTDSIIAA